MSITGNAAQPITKAKKLILAMSPVDSVLDAFCVNSLTEQEANTTNLGIARQDDFAAMVTSCWTDFGPSERYIKRLVMRFVRLAEKNDDEIESDSLANLVAQASCINTNGAPEDIESCYVSFFLNHPESDESEGDCNPLRIRIFPHHNDVALRLWEAGTCLAEYLIENPTIVDGKALIELGSGCGATGLAIAACCNPAKVHLTDYTESCLLNLEHNLVINQEWLSSYNFSPERISQGFLEWEEFMKRLSPKMNCFDGEVEIEKSIPVLDDTLEAFSQADILIAADVIYDINAIDHLIKIVQCFLNKSPKSKQVIFACTKRNIVTFDYFLETIREYDMTYKWIAKGEVSAALKRSFEGHYIQKRSDVQICCIQMASFGER